MKTKLSILAVVVCIIASYLWAITRHTFTQEREITINTSAFKEGDILVYSNNTLTYPMVVSKTDTLAIVTFKGENGRVVLKYSKLKYNIR